MILWMVGEYLSERVCYYTGPTQCKGNATPDRIYQREALKACFGLDWKPWRVWGLEITSRRHMCTFERARAATENFLDTASVEWASDITLTVEGIFWPTLWGGSWNAC